MDDGIIDPILVVSKEEIWKVGIADFANDGILVGARVGGVLS